MSVPEISRQGYTLRGNDPREPLIENLPMAIHHREEPTQGVIRLSTLGELDE